MHFPFAACLLVIIPLGVCGWVAANACAVQDERLKEYSGRESFQSYERGKPLLEVQRSGLAAEAQLWKLPIFAVNAQRGMTVADIGFGSGTHALQLGESVGEGGLVVCREVDQEKLDRLRSSVRERDWSHFDIAKSSRDDVQINAETLDVALLADVYNLVQHQDETRQEFLKSLHDAMKPGGVVVVCYVGTGAILNERPRAQLIEATLTDFKNAGFEPGNRYVFAKERTRPLIFEFRRPCE